MIFLFLCSTDHPRKAVPRDHEKRCDWSGILTLVVLNSFKKHKYLHLLSFFNTDLAQVGEIIPPGRQGPVKPVFNIMAADGLGIRGTRASTTIVMTWLMWNISGFSRRVELKETNDKQCDIWHYVIVDLQAAPIAFFHSFTSAKLQSKLPHLICSLCFVGYGMTFIEPTLINRFNDTLINHIFLNIVGPGIDGWSTAQASLPTQSKPKVEMAICTTGPKQILEATHLCITWRIRYYFLYADIFKEKVCVFHFQKQRWQK